MILETLGLRVSTLKQQHTHTEKQRKTTTSLLDHQTTVLCFHTTDAAMNVPSAKKQDL